MNSPFPHSASSLVQLLVSVLWLLGMDLGWPMALSHGSYLAPRCLDRAMVNQMATGTTQDIDLSKTLHTHARWLSVGPFG